MSWRLINNVDEIMGQYQLFLVDAWGVLHDGQSLYSGARKALVQLKGANKKVIILSNAALRVKDFKLSLNQLGLGPNLFTTTFTSGELVWQVMNNRAGSTVAHLGNRCFCMVPNRNRSILNGLNLQISTSLEHADFILNAGVAGNQPDTRKFDTLLGHAAELQLPMVCANPDQVAIRGGVRGICAGSIARSFEALGGQVIYFGKPHHEIYQQCFELFPNIKPSSILMIGDGLETDIKGANLAGIDSLFLTSGIHQSELGDQHRLSLDDLFMQYQSKPTYVAHKMA